MSRKPAYSIRNATTPTDLIIDNNLEYSIKCGEVMTNIKPIEGGRFEVDLKDFEAYSLIYIVVSDSHAQAAIELAVNDRTVYKRDLRAKRNELAGNVSVVEYELLSSEIDKSKLEEVHTIKRSGLQNGETILIEDLQGLS